MADLGLIPGVAFVTGAGSGMGRETAILFAGAGCKMALLDRNREPCEETAKMLGIKEEDILIIVADIRDDEKCRQAVKDVVAKFGRLDYALNGKLVAGVPGNDTKNTEEDIPDFDFCMSINIRAQYVLARAEIAQMLTQTPLESRIATLDVPESEKSRRIGFQKLTKGSIVMWGSYASHHAIPSASYTASKHGLFGLTRVLSCQHAAQGIRVNMLSPGIIDTPLMPVGYKEACELLQAPPVPQDRICHSAEVGDVALFLCSERASYISGALIPVDGGWNAQ